MGENRGEYESKTGGILDTLRDLKDEFSLNLSEHGATMERQ